MANCVKCTGETANYEYYGIKFEICKSCNSVVISKENFEKLCKQFDPSCEVIDLFSLPAVKIKEQDRICDSCNSTMEKVLCNNVIIDRCKKCGILVFDNGELAKYFSKYSTRTVEIVGNALFIKNLLDNVNKTPATSYETNSQPATLKIVSKVSETVANYSDGWAMVSISALVLLLMIILISLSCVLTMGVFAGFAGILLIVELFLLSGFKILNPQEASVLTLFGKYVGTIKKAGFYWVNPFTIEKRISTKARALDNGRQKINDALGNPIEIGIMTTWAIQDTAKALFNVECYHSFLSAQCDSALRNIARLYPYDAPDNSETQSLRGDSAEISEKLKIEIQNNVVSAGIKILDARITHLAYSSEIAAAMLQRQQAQAIIDAKKALVKSAVGMVEMTLDKLANNKYVNLDEKTKANMVNNLLVVLCANKDSQAVVRTDIV